MMGLVGLMRCPVDAFTAYNCTDISNIVESYLLLEPVACATTDGNGEIETALYRKCLDEAGYNHTHLSMPSKRDNCAPVL
jgi:hypothetical protein